MKGLHFIEICIGGCTLNKVPVIVHTNLSLKGIVQFL